VIRETSDKRMPVMEMEVHELAKRPERSCHLEHGWKGGPDRALYLRCQCRQTVILDAQARELETRVLANEARASLFDSDMAHVDATANLCDIPNPCRYLG